MSADNVMVETPGVVDGPSRNGLWSQLTVSRQKWDLYREEPGFKAAHAQLMAAAGPEIVDTLRAHAVLLVKPEGWAAGVLPSVIDFLRRNDFQIVDGFRCDALTPIMIREIWRYQWNIAPVERIALSEVMLSLGPIYGFIARDRQWDGESFASMRLARMKGPAQPELRVPGQLRYELRAPNRIVSYVHIPDEPADTVRDLSVLFERREMVRLLARVRAGRVLPVGTDPADYPDTIRIDDSVPMTGPVGDRSEPLSRRIELVEAALRRCRRPDDSYRVPPTLWDSVLRLSSEIAALPAPGKKRVAPVAELRR